MMDYFYPRMRARSARLLKKHEIIGLLERSPVETISFLKSRSKFYKLYSKEYAIFYDPENLISIMSKGRYISPILEFDYYCKLLENKNVKKLFEFYLYIFKSKILMCLLSGMYANKSFDDIKSILIITPAISKTLEKYYTYQRIYDICLLLFGDKSFSSTIQNAFSKGSFKEISRIILIELFKKIDHIYQIFYKKSKFVMKYIGYLLLDIKYRINLLGLKLEEDPEFKKYIKYLDEKKICALITILDGSSIKKKECEFNDETLKNIGYALYHDAENIFYVKLFSYDAVMAYILLLEREFKAVNLLSKYYLYGNSLTKERVMELIGVLYG